MFLFLPISKFILTPNLRNSVIKIVFFQMHIQLECYDPESKHMKSQ